MRRPSSLLVACVVVGVAVGYWLGAAPSSPVNPNPPRPIARAVASLIRTAARLGLWIAVSAEPPSQDRQQLVRAPRRDDAGHPVIDHSEGW